MDTLGGAEFDALRHVGVQGVTGWEGGSQDTLSPLPESPAGGGRGLGDQTACTATGVGLDAHAAKSRSCSPLSSCRMSAVPFAHVASPVPPRAR